MRVEEIREHLTNDIIPFWKHLRDDENGGYYGWMDYEHKLDKRAVKGCILNSRITWFFANAYTLLKDESLLDEARHGFEFLKIIAGIRKWRRVLVRKIRWNTGRNNQAYL